jgi:hypothetical protein
MPLPNFRFEVGALTSYHNISGVTGLDDRRQEAFQGLALDLRYRLLDRNHAPFGLTMEVEPHWGRVDESSGEPLDQYSVSLSILMDKELVPDRIVAAFNFVYAPQTTRLRVAGDWERETTLGFGTAIMSQIQPGVLIGADARYLRRYDSLGVPVGNLRSEILVMQSAQNWRRQRAVHSLNGTRNGRVVVER